MTRLLERLGTNISLMAGLCLIASLSACVDREGPANEEIAVRNFVDPVPDGDEQGDKKVVEPFVGNSLNDEGAIIGSQALSLFSFDSEQEQTGDAETTSEILDSVIAGQRRGIVQALDTTYDGDAKSEYSVIVRNDSIFRVDHEEGSYRGLVHFAEPVCELKPRKIVEPVTVGTEVAYRVLHDRSVYVKTSEGNGSIADCTNPALAKRYYRLALSFRFDAFESDPNNSNDLISVSEAEYSAELLFGWNDANATPSNPNQRLDYGFLGYDSQARELVFFDLNRLRVWSQDRQLERFNSPPPEDGGAYLPETWFKVEALPHYQALVQLGRDVFIVDSGAEFFSRAPSEIRTILSDRVYQKVSEAENKYARELEVVHNDTDVLILDLDKLYRFTYAPTSQPPSAFTYTVNDLPVLGYGNERYEQKHLFSQFDLRPCALFSDIDECALVNFNQEANAADWQFVTACTSAVGCSLLVDNTDYCTTQAEFILTQDGSNMCTVLHYTHLNELNNIANDASFLGFMPYVANYARGLELHMDAQSAFITARMNERDILLRYFYQVPMTAPKPSRERVLFGQRIDHAGLDVFLNQGNLFVTSLNKNAVRVDECYIDYVQIDCEECTEAEFLDGRCVDHFNEYRSRALFCSAQRLEDGSCTDNQILPINQLIEDVHSPARDGKWLEVLDITDGNGVVTRTMELVVSDSVKDEGVLSSPWIFPVDNLTGVAGQDEINDALGAIQGLVETVHGRWNLRDQISQLNITRQDILSSDADYAKAGVLFIDPTDQGVPDAPDAVEAGVVHFNRRVDAVDIGEEASD